MFRSSFSDRRSGVGVGFWASGRPSGSVGGRGSGREGCGGKFVEKNVFGFGIMDWTFRAYAKDFGFRFRVSLVCVRVFFPTSADAPPNPAFPTFRSLERLHWPNLGRCSLC